MNSLRQIVHANAAILGPTWRTFSALGAITMFGGSISILVDPIGTSVKVGLPLERKPSSSSSETKESTAVISIADASIARRVADPNALGWVMLFCGRNIAFSLGLLSLNFMGEMRALSVMSQLATLSGIADIFAMRWFGVKDSAKRHWIPMLAIGWITPVGLLLYL